MKRHTLSGYSFVFGLLLFICHAASGNSLQLLTVPEDSWQPPAAGSSDSYAPILTPDANHILFASAAENLCLTTNNTVADNPILGRLNLFVRNRTNATTSLVTVDTGGVAMANGDSTPLGISTDGRFILFESVATNLVSNDTNACADIFRRDMLEGVTVAVSIGTNGELASGRSWGAMSTPDGRYVSFVSVASNLVPDDTNNIPDVFVRDLDLGETKLVGAIGRIYAERSEFPQISDDGRFVAFRSTATNLVEGVAASEDIYLRDLLEETTTKVGVHPETNWLYSNYIISGDGRFVAYQVQASNSLVKLLCVIRRFDRQSNVTETVSTNAVLGLDSCNMSITPNGRFIAFVENVAGSIPTNTVIQVWDGDSGTTTLASGNLAGEVPTGNSDWPAIDPSGRFVAFLSSSTNLVTNSLSGLYHVYVRDLQEATTTLVNVTPDGNGHGVTSTCVPQLSVDGRFVAFEAFDGDLVAGDNNRAHDVFLRDLTSESTELVSARHSQLASGTAAGVDALNTYSVSGSGRYVAFVSASENLVTNDGNGKMDVFVRDLVEDTTTLVSVSTNGVGANGLSIEPSISEDGRYVAFASSASDIARRGINNVLNVFVRDLHSGTTVLVSTPFHFFDSPNRDSRAPQISKDGRKVVFRSRASNLTSFPSYYGTENLYVRSLDATNVVAITRYGIGEFVATPDTRYIAFYGLPIDHTSWRGYVWDSESNAVVYTNAMSSLTNLIISPNGKYLTFSTFSSSIIGSTVYLANLETGTDFILAPATGCFRRTVRFSADERFLVFSSTNVHGTVTDTNRASDVFLYDIQNGETSLISRKFDGSASANGISHFPVISHDGRFIAYRSTASDLVPGMKSLWGDVYLYDRLSGSNTLLTASKRVAGRGGNQSSGAPMFSGDGRSLLFSSGASDLLSDDFDSDGEMFAYQFLYANVTIGDGGKPNISWPMAPDTVYQVQFKNGIDDPAWQNLDEEVVITGNQATVQDSSPAGAQRIYRVIAQ